MIKKLLRISYPLFCTLLVPVILHSQVQKIYLQPKGTQSIRQSQIIDSIRFIPLQPEENVELSMYNNVQITKDYFLINDYTRKTILLYKKDGKFARKIGYKKLGENMYPYYQEQNNQLVFFGNNKNYTLTPKDRVQISLDWNNPHNKKYFKKFSINLDDSRFTIVKDVVNERDVVGANPIGENVYSNGKITTSPLYKDSLDYELKIYRNNELAKVFFPYNSIREPRFLFAEEKVNVNRTAVAGTYLVTRPYCDTVYKLVNDSMIPIYQMIFPVENALPASFLDEPYKNKTERQNYFRSNGWVFHQLLNFYETPAFLYFGVRYMGNFESYVYEKQNGIAYRTKNIRSDSTQYNLKLFGDFAVVSMGNKFYKTLKAGELLTFFNQNKDAFIPPELESFLQAKPQSNAPVLVEFTLKTKL